MMTKNFDMKIDNASLKMCMTLLATIQRYIWTTVT